MPQTYRFDHLHIQSRDPKAVAQYFQTMFAAKAVEGVTYDGRLRIDLDLNGLVIFIFKIEAEENVPASPPVRHLGLDHFGLLVDNLDEAAAELKSRGAEFVMEPRTIKPGQKIAFIRGPENVRIELLERS
ncbi:MAG: VOC family protein [Proteobacteria bacterium]|nr:VOC family protein [Pseudomonadota bacterium]MBU2261191.1 VOC family protein [Pseudomonadota bacterium]